ncbi:60S ribosomal protein L27-3 [Hordeum vulgare]|nr:60S ribosomal protein L27-3 [Hordeum vulgare]
MILLQGRYAEKKVVFVRVFEEGTRDSPYGHCLVTGLAKHQKKVIRKDSRQAPAAKKLKLSELREEVEGLLAQLESAEAALEATLLGEEEAKVELASLQMQVQEAADAV